MTSEQCTHATWCTGERDHEYDCSVATQLADLTAERDALRARAEAADREASLQQRRCEVAEATARELRAEVARLTRKAEDLERTAACAEDMRDAAERERDELRARAEVAEKERDEARRREAAARERLEGERQRASFEQDQFDMQGIALTGVEKERDELRAEVERLRAGDILLVTDLCDLHAFTKDKDSRLARVLRGAVNFIEGRDCFPGHSPYEPRDLGTAQAQLSEECDVCGGQSQHCPKRRMRPAQHDPEETAT
jgi:hypothetical protein